MWLIVGLCVFLLLLCYYKFSNNLLYWKKRGVPHPPASMFFGNMTDVILLKKSIPQLYNEIYDQFPSMPYVGFYKVHKPSLLIRDPNLVKSILTTNFYHFDKNDLDIDPSNDALIAKNPFFTSGEQWKTSRAQVTPSFTSKQMKLNFTLMQQVCYKLIHFLEDPIIANGGIEIKGLCQKYTMDVVALCAMGLEANSFESAHSEFIIQAKKILSPNFFTNIAIMLLFVIPSLASILKVRVIPKSPGNYFTNIIEQTMQYRKTNKVVKNDFLNTMLELQTKLGADKFTNADVTIHALSFFTDGFETSSILISFLLYELGVNIDLQEKLHQEIIHKMEQDKREIDYDFAQELTLLKNFINETLRLHPPAMFLAKRCTKEFNLPPLTPNGKPLNVKPGTSIALPIYSIQTDDKYFSEPATFNPYRFEDNNDTIKTGIYNPFGDGPRACIGQRFALAQSKAAIIHIVLNYEIRLNNKTVTPLQLDPQYFLTAVKGGVWLNFIKRKKLN